MSDWENISDPEGILKPGMRAKFKSSDTEVDIIALHAPSGLYFRPILSEDLENRICKMLYECGEVNISCDPDENGAVFVREKLMVEIRYSNNQTTTVSADYLESIRGV